MAAIGDAHGSMIEVMQARNPAARSGVLLVAADRIDAAAL
jgi:hypothetical protein